MELKAFRHLWGYPIASPETFRKIREAGYAGIETGMLGIDDPQGFLDGLKAHGLEYIGQVYTAGFTKGHSVAEHLAHLETEVCKLLPLGPVLINVHSGEDTWPMDDMHAYFCGAAELEKKLGVPFAHETHRGRCLLHPTISRILLEIHPEIKLVADLSHWVCVCERLLEDQQEIIALAAERTIHVHCRMGHAEAPQVTDPRGDNYAAERRAFEAWWQLIYRSMQKRGLPAFSFCPEYGPPPYMPTLPYTAMPVADLEKICNWQAERIRELVSQWQAS